MAEVTRDRPCFRPCLVAGPIEPRDGQAIPAKTKKVRLCRCGASTKKPFWDGTHSKAGFRREGTASP